MMKRRNLSDLLSDRPIVHPTKIDTVTWRGRQLTIDVRGHRWWASPYEDRHSEGAIRLVFSGLEDGRLFTDELQPEDDEALEDFEVLSVSDVPWAQARDWAIYCSGPIGDPISVYTQVHDYLGLQDAALRAEHFLNQAAVLSSFVTMTQANGFLVGRGPPCIRDLICDELKRQGVPHNVVRTHAETEQRYLVRLGNSVFFCLEAIAEMAD